MKTMKTKNSYQTQRVLSALALLATLTTSALTARAEDNRAPQVPDEIAVPVGNKVHFHGFAVGFQIGGNSLTTSDAKALAAGKSKG